MYDERVIEKIRGIWKTFDLSLGIPEIDKQHLWLIGILADLEDKLESGSRSELEATFTTALSKTLDYASEHFALEEELLESIGYTKLGQHRLQHMRFLTALKNRVRKNFEGNFEHAVMELLKNLKKWLFRHILSEDRQYVDLADVNITQEVSSSLNQRLRSSPHSREIEELYASVVYSTKQTVSKEFNVIGEDNLKLISDLWYRYKLKTGIAIVDIQHLWLLQLLVKTDKLYKQKLKQEIGGEYLSLELKNAIQETIEYIREHFSTEEAIMHNFRYIGERGHQKQHENFNILINDMIDRSEKEELESLAILIQDLKDWLVSHIAIEDKKLFYFFRSRLPEVNEYVRNLNREGKIHIWKEAVMIYKLLVEYEDITKEKTRV
ncbi:hemerythrin [Leptospira hartskeerlii]|uniref:Hemerythrin n=1 Tax=Leptospira hartskeerlii TaxID=2023177 RepID=A0A2M9X8X2_9LEPT|nr:hemerythrin family protein [Leptospira hartskeerlii]PJZ24146.1 hemerythrin [Leptospira hartskeerlii]PJZ35140.1 hemerythrin [Leptospira hartskeerlii]